MFNPFDHRSQFVHGFRDQRQGSGCFLTQMQNSRLELFRVRYFFFHHCDTSNQERIGLKEFSDLKAAAALNEDLTLTVRQSIHPENVRRGAYSVQVFGLWDVYIW